MNHRRMPSIDAGTEWLNSEPLGPSELRGHVVLVDFWTFTCINWLRTEPYIRAWANTYRGDGLVVIGVHTPEFSFEHDTGRIRQAIVDRRIDYPVVVDNDYGVWNAFDNNYWPARYIVDPDGVIRDHHVGEGGSEKSERLIQRLLHVHREPAPVDAVGVEAEADWKDLLSPETYLGYERGQRFLSPPGAKFDEPRTYGLPDHLPFNYWAVDGEWTMGRERVLLDRSGGSIVFRFHARDVHLVMSRSTGSPIPFRVLLDGGPPGASHGSDVDERGDGLLDGGRLYQLVRQEGRVDEHTVEVTFFGPGVEAYAFTFG